MRHSFLPARSAVSRQTIYEDMFSDEGSEKKIPFKAHQMPSDLCQMYVDRVYGARGDFEREEDFNDFRDAYACILCHQIMKHLNLKEGK